MASKPTKPAAPAKDEAEAPAKGNNKLLIIIIALLVVIIAGGAGWFFTHGNKPAEGGDAHVEEKHEPAAEPKFVALGDIFTVNLQREEGDQYLQAGITLKILQPELEEQIKKLMPEIRSKLLFLLASKKPSELQSNEGKTKLVAEIIATTDAILGIAPAVAPAAAHAPAQAQAHDAHGAEHATPATAPAPVAAAAPKITGVVDVMFTSFIIQ